MKQRIQNRLGKPRGFSRGRRRTERDCPSRSKFISELLARRKQQTNHCLRSKHVSVPCDKCGTWPEVVHMPLHLRGLSCQECCPCCSSAASEKDREKEAHHGA